MGRDVMNPLHDRRAFLHAAVAAGAAWAAADLAQVEDALAWAHGQSASRTPVTPAALTTAQADVVEAAAARILPAVDGRPGAREAGAVLFIDRALATFNGAQKTAYVDGVADLNRRAASAAPGTASFAALAPAQQDEVLRAIEQTPFFQALRFDTIVGTFALPTWGGNRDYAGWRLLSVEHQPTFQAPFGYYDAEINRKG
jgi:gluconate 2-dehydrogenase gamma chain